MLSSSRTPMSVKNPPKEKFAKAPQSFAQKEVVLNDTPLFFPAGFEKMFLGIYFLSLPYIAGIMFLFFYVAERKESLFLSLNEESSFILTWAIGYEIIATIIIVYIIKLALSFANNSRKAGPRQFQRP